MLLDEILGVDLRVHPDGDWELLDRHAEDLALELEGQGLRVYRVPVGGSSPMGAYAFAQAGEELKAQGETFDWIFVASSSGSTHVGLAHAFRGSSTRVLGIACDPEPELVDDFAALSAGLAALLGDANGLTAAEFELNLDYVGAGYGVPSPAGQAAIKRLARREGIFLDPIYSGKAFAGLLDLVKAGKIGGRVLFWHTGGLPSLFAMPS